MASSYTRNRLKKQKEEYEKKLVKLEDYGLPHELANIQLPNPLEPKTDDDVENPHLHLLRLMRKPEHFHFTCKHIFNIDLAPFQVVILHELWYRKYPMLIASRGASKSYLLALYSMLRALFNQGSKIIIVGAAFRQAKVIFEYCENIWQNAPILRDIVGIGHRNGPRRDIDRCTCKIGDSLIVAIPLGDGSKIRGQRANIIIADEFSSIPKDIYETVVSGFAAVSSSPRINMRRAARIRVLKKLGKWSDEQADRELKGNRGNQSILSGTASFAFNHFAEYWKEYKSIIESKGDMEKLLHIFNGKLPSKFNWRNYSVIRIPFELVPEGFMDEEHVARAQLTTDKGNYAVEYGAVFATDTAGFFKRSIIEGATVRHDNLHYMLPGVDIFHPVTKGRRDKQYIFGIDTASEADNFVISILEVYNNHRRLVYVWSTQRQKYIEQIKEGNIKQKDFFAYCSRKIRDLMKVFPCIHINMDAQGGGRQISEALHDDDKLQPGELPLWEIRDEKKEKWSDSQAGLHIIELVEFSNPDWTSEANMGLKKDMEDKVLLFPYLDPVHMYLSVKQDKKLGRVKIKNGKEIRLEDTVEDVMAEIEETKEELTTIEHTQTPGTNRNHWDTPEVKRAGNKKGRLRKDRYSALLLANMAARQLLYAPPPTEYKACGGFAKSITSEKTENLKNMPLYDNPPDWFVNPSQAATYGMAVRTGHGRYED